MIQSRKNALQIAQEIFRSFSLHSSIMTFRKNLREDYGFYEGNENKQWLQIDLDTLAARRQAPITANITQGYIDAVSGVEIQSRHRAACRSDSQHPEDEELTEVLTHYLYNIQESNSVPYNDSLKFRDSLICGIGWSDIFKENRMFYHKYVHPSLVLFDPNDLSPQLSNMSAVCRKRFMRADVIKKKWPKLTQYIDFSSIDSFYDSLLSAELIDRNSDYSDTNTPSGASSGQYLVVEVQNKIEKDAYSGVDKKGHYFETFSEEDAIKMASSKKDIQEITATQIMRTLFLGDILLEYGPLPINIPNQKDFTLVPFVWKREFLTGIPYGLLPAMKPIQRDANSRLTKAIYTLNSSQIIFEADSSFFEGSDINRIRTELKNRDGVIVLPKDSKFQINTNSPLTSQHMEIVEYYLKLMQRVTNINDEMMGIQTNATSGISKNISQASGVRNQIFAFDSFAEMKKREASLMLSLIQANEEDNIAVQVLTEDEREWVVLNFTYETKDGPQIFNNIRNLPLSIYIEEVPDYRSSFEERKANLEFLLNHQNASMLMLSPTLMKEMGIREAEKLSQEMRAAMQEKAMIEQGMQMAQNPQVSLPQQEQLPAPELLQGLAS